MSFLKLQTLFSDLFLHLGYCCSHQCHFKECSWWQVKTKLEKISTIIPSPCHCYFGVWGHQFCRRAVRFTSSAQPPCDLSSQCSSTGCFAGMCSWGKKIWSLHCWSSCCIPSKGKQIFLFTSDASFSLFFEYFENFEFNNYLEAEMNYTTVLIHVGDTVPFWSVQWTPSQDVARSMCCVIGQHS